MPISAETETVLAAWRAVEREVERAKRIVDSQILRADAKHTRSDVWTTSAVLVALLGAWMGYPRFDPFAGLVVAIFIGQDYVDVVLGR